MGVSKHGNTPDIPQIRLLHVIVTASRDPPFMEVKCGPPTVSSGAGGNGRHARRCCDAGGALVGVSST